MNKSLENNANNFKKLCEAYLILNTKKNSYRKLYMEILLGQSEQSFTSKLLMYI